MLMSLFNPINAFECFLFVFGGLGIFLYGINLMGDSLKDLAGSKLKMIIEKSTNTPLKGILIGTLLTVIIQSSSGTTALTVGLVRAGLMTLPQAIGIIMGANIGTTVTSFIVGLNIQKYSLIFVGIGAILIFFINSRKIKDLGKVICGFGLLFFGLQLMDAGLDYILATYEEQCEQLFTTFGKYPILGLLIGSVVTAIVQSSSATIGILQTLYATGEIVLLGALPMLIGANIGTTVTAVIASAGGGTEAKKTSMFHLIFNISGAILFMIILRFAFVPLMTVIDNWLSSFMGDSPAMTIAVAHFIFNFTTTFLLFFLINPIIKLINKVIKDAPTEEEEITVQLDELLDYSLIKESSSLALEFVDKCMLSMGKLVVTYFEIAKNYAFDKESIDLEKAKKLEDNIDLFDKRIHDYLVNLTLENIQPSENKQISRYLDTIKDYERIGDHCSNIIEFFNDRYNKNLEMSLDSLQDLEQMFASVDTMVNNSVKAFSNWDLEAAKLVEETENKVDAMQELFHERHLHRINSGACTYHNTEYYIELLTNLERIGDHCKNVSDTILALNRAS